MTTPVWTRSKPTKEGFYFFRVTMNQRPEIIECYLAGRDNGALCYNWGPKDLLLGKRLHDVAAVDAQELSNFYLVYPGEFAPRPIVIAEAMEAAVAPAKKAKSRPKKVKP